MSDVYLGGVEDYQNLSLNLLINGEERQAGDTNCMIHDVGSQLRHISKFMTLEEGDLIFTGTPPGNKPVKIGDALHATLHDYSTGENICTLDLSIIEKNH